MAGVGTDTKVRELREAPRPGGAAPPSLCGHVCCDVGINFPSSSLPRGSIMRPFLPRICLLKRARLSLVIIVIILPLRAVITRSG